MRFDPAGAAREHQAVNHCARLRAGYRIAEQPRFLAVAKLGTHFLVRTCTNRSADDGERTVADEMSEVRVKGLHRIEFRDAKGCPDQAVLEIRYRRLTVWPAVAKQPHYPPLRLSVIHATECGDPADRPRGEWKPLIDLPVSSRADAIEKIDWYGMRWKIETFHKNLKSDCKAEESQLRTASRLTNLIAIFCILAGILADRDQPIGTRGLSGGGIYRNRDGAS